ncbi:unnamed protein product [Sphagnum jensenii]
MSAAKTDRALSLQSHRRVKTRNQNQKPILLLKTPKKGREKKLEGRDTHSQNPRVSNFLLTTDLSPQLLQIRYQPPQTFLHLLVEDKTKKKEFTTKFLCKSSSATILLLSPSSSSVFPRIRVTSTSSSSSSSSSAVRPSQKPLLAKTSKEDFLAANTEAEAEATQEKARRSQPAEENAGDEEDAVRSSSSSGVLSGVENTWL